MRVSKQYQAGALLVTVPTFADSRGSLAVPYEVAAARGLGLPAVFAQDVHSISDWPGTIRGIHLQLPPHEQGKLVRVLRGAILDVIIDLRPGSDHLGRHEEIELSAGGGLQLWIPPGFGHGFVTLEAGTEVFYKCDAPYVQDREWTLAWDDPTLGVDWPLGPEGPVLSVKDQAGHSFEETMAAIIEAGS